MQNFGVTNKGHYGMLRYFLECSIAYGQRSIKGTCFWWIFLTVVRKETIKADFTARLCFSDGYYRPVHKFCFSKTDVSYTQKTVRQLLTKMGQQLRSITYVDL